MSHGEHPLAGLRVVVTRAVDQAPALASALGELGAQVVHLPTIRTVAARSPEIVRIVRLVSTYDWLAFTSENGVRYLLEALQAAGGSVDDLAAVRCAAVGRGTSAALAAAGLEADFVPSQAIGEAMLREFAAGFDLAGRSILRVRGDLAPRDLERGLRAVGARVETATVYQTRHADPDPQALARLREGPIAAVTFASGSAVEGFSILVPERSLRAAVPAVCIGPVTAMAARRAGWRRIVTAVSTSPGDVARAVVTAVGGG